MVQILQLSAAFLTAYVLRPLYAFVFRPEQFLVNAKYMGVGMLCILLVMLIIICVVLVLNKLSSVAKSKKSDSEK